MCFSNKMGETCNLKMHKLEKELVRRMGPTKPNKRKTLKSLKAHKLGWPICT